MARESTAVASDPGARATTQQCLTQLASVERTVDESITSVRDPLITIDGVNNVCHVGWLQVTNGEHGITLRLCQAVGVTSRATLFDMDGLLIDSEVLWHRAEVEIFGHLGVPITQTEDRLTKGMFVREVVAYWYDRYPWTGPSQEAIVSQLLERVGDLVESDGRLLEGALRAIDMAAQRGPIALASSTPLALIDRCLAHFGLLDRFALRYSAEFEPYGKPHPGVFLSAAAGLGVGAEDCLVFEDSSAGVTAAKAAHMSVVAVPAAEDRDLPAFAMADLVLGSLAELSADWLDRWFGA